MTRIYRTIAVAVIGALVVLGCTKGYESQKTVDDLTIKLTVGSYPLVKGDNTLTVKVTDAAGKAVSDAKMDVRYYMPPMPGMAPMDFSGQAMLRGDARPGPHPPKSSLSAPGAASRQRPLPRVQDGGGVCPGSGSRAPSGC